MSASHFGGGVRTDWSLSLEQPTICGIPPLNDVHVAERAALGYTAAVRVRMRWAALTIHRSILITYTHCPMQFKNLPRQAQILLSVVLLGAGLALFVWALSNIPGVGDSPTATVLTPVAQATAGGLASGLSPAGADSATAVGEPQVTRTVAG